VLPLRRRPVDGDRPDGQSLEVEVEARQVLGGDRLDGGGAPVAQQLGSAYQAVYAADDTTARAEIRDAAFVLDAYMRVRFDAAMLDSATGLRAFVTATTGADHVDSKALERRGIPLLTLRGQREVLRNLTPAAELSWFLLMACARGARAAVDEVLTGVWNRNNHPGLMLRGRTLGVVGCGRIGQWMARYAAAFGMRTVGFDPHLDVWPDTIARASLDELLSQSDVVSIHVPLNDETKGLIGRAQFERIKDGAILVNTSRGEIVDETAMLAALQSGKLRAVGLDVLTGEPEIDKHPLVTYARSHPNVIITPHIGGFSPDAVREVLAFCCGRIRELTAR
jgi:D-3-phosphoglycerate dehydrogenase